MIRPLLFVACSLFILLLLDSCTNENKSTTNFTGAKDEVKLMTLDPGHFHAALVQKVMYDQVSPAVHIYAPEGSDVEDHLNRIAGYNGREQDPTHWDSKVYTGNDFLEKMLREKPGNVVVISGNNQKKTEYIKAAVDAGLNVLADKPLCISKPDFDRLQTAFVSAGKNGVLLYDIMTERYEITTSLQKELANNPEVFGTLEEGTPDNPAVTKESVHHYFKYVSGNPLKRPAWYFDTSQQGEGIVDVTTHLVDLVQWECFPEQIIDYKKDVEVIRARHWPTLITREQFEKVTRLPEFPDFLTAKLNNEGALPVYANGEIIYKLKGIHAKVSVVWNYEAPAGGSDTHFSVMRGTKARVVIMQGTEQNYRPELYVEAADPQNEASVEAALQHAIAKLQSSYSGLAVQKEDDKWHILIPDEHRVGHEAHFGQVTQKYLKYLVDGKLPEWEVPNMIAKYFTTIAALELALQTP